MILKKAGYINEKQLFINRYNDLQESYSICYEFLHVKEPGQILLFILSNNI